MDCQESVEFLENLKAGECCTIEFPLTPSISVKLISKYVDKRDDIYNFIDYSGELSISKKFVEQDKIRIVKEFDEEKAKKIAICFQNKQIKENKKKQKRDNVR